MGFKIERSHLTTDLLFYIQQIWLFKAGVRRIEGF